VSLFRSLMDGRRGSAKALVDAEVGQSEQHSRVLVDVTADGGRARERSTSLDCTSSKDHSCDGEPSGLQRHGNQAPSERLSSRAEVENTMVRIGS
jgi:hypothetical protein